MLLSVTCIEFYESDLLPERSPTLPTRVYIVYTNLLAYCRCTKDYDEVIIVLVFLSSPPLYLHVHVQLQFPAGAFDCWAYMTCNEAIQAIMARLDADSLISATSSLLLVRAELWRYALEKVFKLRSAYMHDHKEQSDWPEFAYIVPPQVTYRKVTFFSA